MIDIRILRENPELVKENAVRRGCNVNIDELRALDQQCLATMKEVESLRAERNRLSKDCKSDPAAREAVALGDPNAESAGESLSRARMVECGLEVPELQVSFRDDEGFVGRVDGFWREVGIIGEFDGKVKYGRQNPDEKPSEVFATEVLKAAKGFYGRRKNTIRIAKQAVEKSLQYAYRDRKNRKRNFRALWIQRINAAVRAEGMTYNRFIQGLKAAEVSVDRRVLADLAVNDPAAFNALVAVAKAALPADVNAPASA